MGSTPHLESQEYKAVHVGLCKEAHPHLSAHTAQRTEMKEPMSEVEKFCGHVSTVPEEVLAISLT